jgi:hypothetical protein
MVRLLDSIQIINFKNQAIIIILSLINEKDLNIRLPNSYLRTLKNK